MEDSPNHRPVKIGGVGACTEMGTYLGQYGNSMTAQYLAHHLHVYHTPLTTREMLHCPGASPRE